ncbi:Endonuclease/exonuclease/phosphatase [Rhodocollybia butyracea]|uniref:Endonuclease/exonuclease/phosphatase n=1 Tax=Rhodocollybia butyracea TaxID=206335 RepID=A0A9P5Q9S0_9AGAR|nr:Endonuclease/exonuclease/phosphatase [Rhodocollybia butyracea]
MKGLSLLTFGLSVISVTHSTLVTDVQGIAFLSPFAAQTVSNVTGIVTAKGSEGFYISGTPSRDIRASNGLFIFSESSTVLNAVAVGDEVSVTGNVTEFRSSTEPDYLTGTEITSPSAANIVVLSTGNTVAPVILGTDRSPPTQVLSALDKGPDGWLSVPNAQFEQDTVNATLKPAKFGLDFWSSLEGQLVTAPSPLSIGFPNDFGEFWVVGDWPVTGLNSRGGLTLTVGRDNIPDANPEAVIIGSPLDGTKNPNVSVGVKLSDITGVVQYQFGFYYIVPLTAPKVLSTPTNTAPPTHITANIKNKCAVTFGDYNVDNFGPNATQLPAVATHIAVDLLSPDIVFLQEILDNDGATNDGVVNSNVTLSNLISAIANINGVVYDFVVIDPINNADGGETGGNIRQAYLYRSQKLSLVGGSPAGTATEAIAVTNNHKVPKLSLNPGRIDPNNTAWVNSRKPLVAEWKTRGGATLFTVNLHLESKDGSSSTQGNPRPPINLPVAKRTTQVELVADFVQSVLDIDKNANILVAGDCNEFLETRSVFKSLTAVMTEMDVLANIDPVERYTYVFDGTSEQLDHAFVSPALARRKSSIQHIHVNNWLPNINDRASDHDPSVGKVNLC